MSPAPSQPRPPAARASDLRQLQRCAALVLAWTVVAVPLTVGTVSANTAVVLSNGNRMEVREAFVMGAVVRLDLLRGGSIRVPAEAVKRISKDSADLPPRSAAGVVTTGGIVPAMAPLPAPQPEIQLALTSAVADLSEAISSLQTEPQAPQPQVLPGVSVAQQQQALHRSLTPKRGMMRDLLSRADTPGVAGAAREEGSPGRKRR